MWPQDDGHLWADLDELEQAPETGDECGFVFCDSPDILFRNLNEHYLQAAWRMRNSVIALHSVSA